MNVILFLIMATLILYVFTHYFPWFVESFRRTLPPSSPPHRQLPGYSPHSRRSYQRKKNRPQVPSTPLRTPDIQTLQPGDVVMYLQRDFIVGEARRVCENDWTWQDYILEDGNDICILSVTDTGDDIFLLEPVSDLTLAYPPPNTLIYRNQSYTLTSAGQAHIEETQERFRYYTYEGTHHILVAENWGAQFDVFLGERISPQDLTFLPGSAPEKNSPPR